MELPKQYAEAIVQHALEEAPNECCGLLAGKGGKIRGLFRMTNAEGSPSLYRMGPEELMWALGRMNEKDWRLIAIYHSHTHSPAYPSATDVRLATWPDAYYLLVSLMDKADPDLRAFLINDGEMVEEAIVA